jgi:flagellar M-ring protein FliF
VLLLDRFRAFPIRQQIVLVCLMAAVSCLLFASIWFFFLRTSFQPLFTNLRPADAATIVADLERKKIDYRLADGGSTIFVPADIVDSTRLNVGAEDLPLKGTVGFELFNKSDMGLTDFAQKINYQRALQGELERTIMTVDGIDSVRVHLSLGEDRIFRDDRVPPKASVMVRMQRGRTLPAIAASGIQRLVAAAVPNLQAGDVVILDDEGSVVGPAEAPARSEPVPPAVEIEQGIEEYYAGRVRQAVAQAYPQAAIAVSVAANLLPKPDGASADWNPAARDFPLRITLSSPRPLDAGAQDTLRSLAGNAVGFDPAKNDTVEFSVAPNAPPPGIVEQEPVSASHVVPLRKSRVEEEGGPEWQTLGSTGLVLGLLLLIFFIMARRLRRPRRLSDKQRQDFAARLRAALEQGGSHVAARP